MILATLLYRGVEENNWEVVVISQEMIDRKEQPRCIGPFSDITQHESVIISAFPGATEQTINMCMPAEMRAYLKNVGYDHVEALSKLEKGEEQSNG